MKSGTWIAVLIAIAFYLTFVGGTTAAEDAPADSGAAVGSWRHNPYDLAQGATVDSSDVYVTRTNHLLALPRYIWTGMVYPLGAFTIYAEHARLWTRYYELFTNAAGTFGVFPQVQFGGETGTGGGATLFHTNVAGKRKIFTGRYVYSGSKGQVAEGLYIDPNVMGSGFIWKVEGGYFRTRHRDANINGAIHQDLGRLFEFKQITVQAVLEWRLNKGPMAPFLPNLSVEGWFGFAREDFQPFLGGTAPLTDPGSTPQARLLRGLGSTLDLYRLGGRVAYDSRDYKPPAKQISHPLNYRLPGRMVKPFDDLYYFFRDVAYPERGGLVAVEAEWVTGPDEARFYRVAAQVQHYVTIFWKDRVLAVRGRLDKVRSTGGRFVPYTEMVQMGGKTSARGYRRGHFRGQGALQFNVEYRYPIWDTWNAFLFWDEGHIFDHYDKIGWDGFRSSWGAGIAFRTEIGLLGKFQVGHSEAENALFGFTVEQAF